MPWRARIFEIRSQSRATTSDVHDSTGQQSIMRRARMNGLRGLFLMCMKPRTFSCKSVDCMHVGDAYATALWRVQ